MLKVSNLQVSFKIEEKEILVNIVEQALEDAKEENKRLASMTDEEGTGMSMVTFLQASKMVEKIQAILDKIKGTSTTTEA